MRCEKGGVGKGDTRVGAVLKVVGGAIAASGLTGCVVVAVVNLSPEKSVSGCNQAVRGEPRAWDRGGPQAPKPLRGTCNAKK